MFKVKNLCFFVFLLFYAAEIKGFQNFSKLQQKPTLYLIPGQGADARLFNNLKIEEAEIKVLTFLVQEKNESLADYARRMAAQIDTTQKPFFIGGSSLGGMICIEMAKFMHPAHIFLFSSAKTRQELPFRYRFQKFIPIYKILPARLIKRMAIFVQPRVEHQVWEERSIFRTMLESKNTKFMKRSIHCICTWDNNEIPVNVTHFHGSKDRTLPFRNIKNADMINNGSHMLVYFNGLEIGKKMDAIIQKKNTN
jgi:pimeloyl-ACP methyl ester carboxylesterase